MAEGVEPPKQKEEQSQNDAKPPVGWVVGPVKDDPRDILFVLPPRPITADEQRFKDRVEQTLTILRSLFPDTSPRFSQYLNALIHLSAAALVGPHPSASIGISTLDTFQNDVLAAEGGRFKNAYIAKLGVAAAVLAAPSAVLAGVLLAFPTIQQPFLPLLLIWTGSMVGAWVSFGIRKSNMTFDDLATPEQDRVNPFARLIYTGILSIVLGSLLLLKAAELRIGSVSSDAVDKNQLLGLTVGFFAGFSEKALANNISKHATQAFGGTGSAK